MMFSCPWGNIKMAMCSVDTEQAYGIQREDLQFIYWYYTKLMWSKMTKQNWRDQFVPLLSQLLHSSSLLFKPYHRPLPQNVNSCRAQNTKHPASLRDKCKVWATKSVPFLFGTDKAVERCTPVLPDLKLRDFRWASGAAYEHIGGRDRYQEFKVILDYTMSDWLDMSSSVLAPVFNKCFRFWCLKNIT